MVFVGLDNGIYQVSPFGGDPVFIADGGPQTRHPHLLPDGKAVVFQGSVDGRHGLMLVEIESAEVISLETGGC